MEQFESVVKTTLSSKKVEALIVSWPDSGDKMDMSRISSSLGDLEITLGFG